ncbi:MAG: hypothetical protein KBT53_01610 [Porticoccus sp.]|nr:hypothetical protein [Porticoccus sp.]MBQ0807573.1 hypothetical protein [Porticoccus sp.]
MLKIVTGMLFLLYPFLIYLGLKEFQPRTLAVMLLLVSVLRFTAWKSDESMPSYWIVAVVLVVILTFVTNTKFGVYLYPVLINLALFFFFFLSLFHPPTVIEKIARRHRPELPPHAVVYTRKVTWAWCLFFIFNGGMSVLSLLVSDQWWLLYNGLISYCLIGAFWGGEYMIRVMVMRQYDT